MYVYFKDVKKSYMKTQAYHMSATNLSFVYVCFSQIFFFIFLSPPKSIPSYITIRRCLHPMCFTRRCTWTHFLALTSCHTISHNVIGFRCWKIIMSSDCARCSRIVQHEPDSRTSEAHPGYVGNSLQGQSAKWGGLLSCVSPTSKLSTMKFSRIR